MRAKFQTNVRVRLAILVYCAASVRVAQASQTNVRDCVTARVSVQVRLTDVDKERDRETYRERSHVLYRLLVHERD